MLCETRLFACFFLFLSLASLLIFIIIAEASSSLRCAIAHDTPLLHGDDNGSEMCASTVHKHPIIHTIVRNICLHLFGEFVRRLFISSCFAVVVFFFGHDLRSYYLRNDVCENSEHTLTKFSHLPMRSQCVWILFSGLRINLYTKYRQKSRSLSFSELYSNWSNSIDQNRIVGNSHNNNKSKSFLFSFFSAEPVAESSAGPWTHTYTQQQ